MERFSDGDLIMARVTWKNINLPPGDFVNILVIFVDSETGKIATFKADDTVYMYSTWDIRRAPDKGSTRTDGIGSRALKLGSGTFDALVAIGDDKLLSDISYTIGGRTVGIKVISDDLTDYFGPDGVYDCKKFSNVMSVS